MVTWRQSTPAPLRPTSGCTGSTATRPPPPKHHAAGLWRSENPGDERREKPCSRSRERRCLFRSAVAVPSTSTSRFVQWMHASKTKKTWRPNGACSWPRAVGAGSPRGAAVLAPGCGYFPAPFVIRLGHTTTCSATESPFGPQYMFVFCFTGGLTNA